MTEIEEIALDLNHIIHFKDNGLVARYATAEAMYNMGYRKHDIVRCKDCAHYLNGKCYVSNRTNKGVYPRVNIHSCNDDDFCSYGERK